MVNREHWIWSWEPWVLDLHLQFASYMNCCTSRISISPSAKLSYVTTVVSASLTGATVVITEPSCQGVLSVPDHNEINKGSWFLGFCNAHADTKTNTKQQAVGYTSKWKVCFKMFSILQFWDLLNRIDGNLLNSVGLKDSLLSPFCSL